MDTAKIDTSSGGLADGALVVRDRRRPGRRAVVSAALLPLLRQSERDRLPPLDDEDDAYQPSATIDPAPRGLGDGRGVVLGLGIGALMWAGLITGIAALLRALE